MGNHGALDDVASDIRRDLPHDFDVQQAAVNRAARGFLLLEASGTDVSPAVGCRRR